MRLCIFGGTGPTGLRLVEQAVATGHDVVAYARRPDKLAPHSRLTVVEGQLDDANQIKAAVAGSDAVLSLLGPGTKAADTPPLVTGYRNIVAAMHQHNARRLVALGTPSIADPADGKDWKFALMVKLVGTLQPTAYNAIVSIGRIVRESDLDWTIARVPLLSNGPRTDRLNVGQVGPQAGLRLSRANAAAFILGQATDTTYFRKAPLISDRALPRPANAVPPSS